MLSHSKALEEGTITSSPFEDRAGDNLGQKVIPPLPDFQASNPKVLKEANYYSMLPMHPPCQRGS